MLLREKNSSLFVHRTQHTKALWSQIAALLNANICDTRSKQSTFKG